MVKYVKGGKMIAGKNYVKAKSVNLGIPIGQKDGFKYYSTKFGLIAVPDVPEFDKASNIETDYKRLVNYTFDSTLPKPEQIYKEKQTGELLETRPSIMEHVTSESVFENSALSWPKFLKKYRKKYAADLVGVPYKQVQKQASDSYKKYKALQQDKVKNKSKSKVKDFEVNKDALSKIYQGADHLEGVELMKKLRDEGLL